MNFDDAATAEMLGFCRVAAATPDELARMLQVYGAVYSGHQPKVVRALSAENEIRALEMIAENMRECLKRYPTTRAEDLEFVKSGEAPPFSNRQHASIVGFRSLDSRSLLSRNVYLYLYLYLYLRCCAVSVVCLCLCLCLFLLPVGSKYP